MLASHQAELVELHQHWQAFVDYETARLAPMLEEDLLGLEKSARSHRDRVDQARKHLHKNRARYAEWANGVREVELTRVAHVGRFLLAADIALNTTCQTRQDITDHTVFVSTEWANALHTLQEDGALWAVEGTKTRWRLDFTEGHCRMRKKLEVDQAARGLDVEERAPVKRGEQRRKSSRNDSHAFDERLHTDPSPSPIMSPASAEEESIWRGDAFSSTEAASRAEHDDLPEEDKNRKVRRSLEPGDVIEAVYNANRIDGLDAFRKSPCSLSRHLRAYRVVIACLLLFAKRNIYLVDGYFQRENGELVNAQDAPPEERDQHLQTLSDLAGRGSKRDQVVLLNDHRARQWAWSDLIECHERKFVSSVSLKLVEPRWLTLGVAIPKCGVGAVLCGRQIISPHLCAGAESLRFRHHQHPLSVSDCPWIPACRFSLFRRACCGRRHGPAYKARDHVKTVGTTRSVQF